MRRLASVVLLALILPALTLVPASQAYGSDTTAFALLIGAVVVCVRIGGAPGRARWWALPVAGALMVWVATWDLRPTVTLGLPLLVLLFGVVLWTVTGEGPVRVLEARWLRWFGERSYGIYLWHAPILWAMRDHYELPWLVLVLVGVPVSLLLAEASYRWVEAPFRRRRSPSPVREPALT